jgi:DinB family protein
MHTLRGMSTWNDDLVEQLDWHWTNHARPRLAGLTDDEYLWEPAPDAWSVRPRAAARTVPVGRGDVVIDFVYPTPEPAPVTTIAWRMAHVAIGVFGARAANHFGEPGSVDYDSTEWPITATGGLALLDRHYAAWTAGVRSLGEEGLSRPCGPAEGPYADHPMSALVLHINREAIHHMAEIALLRDLYIRREAMVGVHR